MSGRANQFVSSLLFFFIILLFLCTKIFFTEGMAMAQARNTTVLVNVGVLLDMNNWVGKMGWNCISMALSDFYSSHGHYKTRLVLNLTDSKDNVVGAAAAALYLLNTVRVQAIIGPLTSMQANFLIHLGDEAHVPIISFSATSPSLSSLHSPYFFRAALSDSSQVQPITAIIQAFGWREVVLIYIDNEDGAGLIPFLTDALREIEVRVPYKSIVNPSASDEEIISELYKLMTKQTRVFVVHMSPFLSARLFTKAKEVGMMSEGYAWIITDRITNSLNFLDPSIIEGVIGVKPHVPKSKKHEDFINRWKKKSQQEKSMNSTSSDLNIFGLWAYDAATALAMAVERVGSVNFNFHSTNVSRYSTEIETVGVSETGIRLRQALSETGFRGLSGNFTIVNGQLQSSAFEIVNVIGMGPRRIGFWTPEYGIVKEFDDLNPTKYYSTSRANLKAIIWPGDMTYAPKGWVVPTNEKVLKVGVPVKDGFNDFVRVTIDNSTNTTKVTGYCIDIFEATMAALPYNIPYKYIPFTELDGADYYDNMVKQVFHGNFDAVVGDVTITANRSLYVDFTLPYTAESGVKMIVPLKDKQHKNAWVFLKPLTWDLWVTSACFFVFISFVVWILEHQTNDLHQVSVWFPLSAVVFADKEKVVSNLARFVVIIWCFVVLILTQSYIASLTSILTVQQLEPSVTDVRELITKGLNVGYPKGSFVYGLLIKMNFTESQLKEYSSLEGLDIAFSNQSIAAAFDEIPYLKLAVGKHCSKYTMVEPTHKTGGFGFVFPKGSPLVGDVSAAILNVIEEEKMSEIERALIGQISSCPESSSNASFSSLSVGSFWGLFLIVGVASSFALIIFLAMLLYEHRNFLIHLSLKTLWTKYITKHEENDTGTHQDQATPSSALDDTDGTFVGFEEQETLRVDTENHIPNSTKNN